MSDQPKLSEGFNKKLFSDIKRNVLYKNIITITFMSFIKVFVSFFEVFSGTKLKKETKSKLDK